jgi:hypothetical protein
MLPNTKIVIDKKGNSTIEGLEKSESCHKLSDIAKGAGKVTSDTDKDHTPVYQTVSQKNN